MTQTRLQTLTRAELLDEVRRLGHGLDSADLDALLALDVVPFSETDEGDMFPLFALVQVVDALDTGAPLMMDELRERSRTFMDAMDGVANGVSSAHRELRQLLAQRSVLGELHRMLPVMEIGALETLRGEARLEWRLRMSLAEITRLLATDRFRDDAMTPVRPPRTTSSASQRATPSVRKPRLTTRSGAAIIPGLLPTNDAGVPTELEPPVPRAGDAGNPTETLDAGDEPWPSPSQTILRGGRQPAPGVGPHRVDDDGSPIEIGVRMPFLADLDDSDSNLPPKSATAAFQTVNDPESEREETEPFISELSTSRISSYEEFEDFDEAECALSQSPASASGSSARLKDARLRARARADDVHPTAQLETPTSSPLTAMGEDEWESMPTLMTESVSDEAERVEDRRPIITQTGDSPDLNLRPRSAQSSAPRIPQATQDFDVLKLTPAARAREEAIARSRSESETEVSDPKEITSLGGRMQSSVEPRELPSARRRNRAADRRRLQADPPGDEAGQTSGATRRSPATAESTPRRIESWMFRDRVQAWPRESDTTVQDHAGSVVEDVQGVEANSQAEPVGRDEAEPHLVAATTVDAAPPVEAAPASADFAETKTPDISPFHPSRSDEPQDSVEDFLADGFSPPPASDSGSGQRRRHQTDLHMATADERPHRLSRHTDLLVETAGLRATSSHSDSRVELPVRKRATSTGVDIQAVLSDPHAAYERSAARLEANGDDTAAQEELLAIVGGNDRELARKAWATVAPFLRERRGRSDALFGGLVMMSARDPDPSVRVRHLREAAGVAESVLGDHKQAFELITDAIALAPNEELLTDRAETIAEAFGWWEDYVARLSDSALDVGDQDRRVQLTRLAGQAARDRLSNPGRTIELYEGVVAEGIYDEDIVASLIDLYARESRGQDTLVLLLRCAEIAEGEERVERLTRAADLCVEELNDLDRALEIYEAALKKGDHSSEVRARYVGLARRSGHQERAIAQLAIGEQDPYENAMTRAQIARSEFDDVDLEIDALVEAFAVSGGSEKLKAGFALADAQRKDGRVEHEVRTLEDMLADVGPGERRVSVVRRLAGVLVAKEGGKEQAIEHYSESIRAGEFDEKLVHAVVSLLRADGRFDELIETLVLAAQNSGTEEERVGYYRQVARVASESIEDDEQALALIEQTVDASDGDAEVLVQMAIRSRRAGDDLSEMAALEQAVHDDSISVDPSFLMRLAELELARPRGATRAAELVERVLDLQPLTDTVSAEVGRVLPAVVEDAGRHDLDLRWSWTQAERARDEADAYVLWTHVVSLQEHLGDEPDRRLRAVEAAMGSAADVNADDVDRARLELSAARVKRVMGHWNVAVEHARTAAIYFLEHQPTGIEVLEAVASVAELTQYVIDERPALRLLREAADTGHPPLMAAYAEALMYKSRWHDALPILERLVDGTTDPDMLERLQSELERARTEASI